MDVLTQICKSFFINVVSYNYLTAEKAEPLPRSKVRKELGRPDHTVVEDKRMMFLVKILKNLLKIPVSTVLYVWACGDLFNKNWNCWKHSAGQTASEGRETVNITDRKCLCCFYVRCCCTCENLSVVVSITWSSLVRWRFFINESSRWTCPMKGSCAVFCWDGIFGFFSCH